jgi:F0F1-type ATP synthase assembly protein I
LPPKYKRNSVSYYQALEVALIGGLMFGAAIFFLQQAFFYVTALTWIISLLSGFAMTFIQTSIYTRLTK